MAMNLLNDMFHALSNRLETGETCPVTIGNDINGKCYHLTKDSENNIIKTAEEYWYTDKTDKVHYSYQSWSNNRPSLTATETEYSLAACREARRNEITEELKKRSE